MKNMTHFACILVLIAGYGLLVLAPALYLVGEPAAANLRNYVRGGGHLMVSYFSGIVDAADTVPPGASPGPLRDLLGLEIHEFLPLREPRQSLREAIKLCEDARPV